MVAGGARGRSGLGVSQKVIDGVERNYDVDTGLIKSAAYFDRVPNTYWYPHDVALCVLCTLDEDSTEQSPNSSEKVAKTQDELNPSDDCDDSLDFCTHGLDVAFAIRQGEVTVRMPVEIDQGAFGFLLW